MEGDSPLGHNSGRGDVFQSTPSAWRETQGRPAIYRRSFISIHSLRMEGDFTTVIAFYFGTHFNPLPPHGGRQNDLTIVNTALVISIHSLRMEGDAGVVVTLIGFCISIHSLRMEGDLWLRVFSDRFPSFQSTPSAWRETC